MMEKENVCEMENSSGAETARMAQGGENRSAAKENLTAPCKFKDVDALKKAYEALEAEFTRRSQRLKVLEKQVENFSLAQEEAKRGGAEKLKRNAETRRAEAKAFDAFVATVGSADRIAADEKPESDSVTDCSQGDVKKTEEQGAELAQLCAGETFATETAANACKAEGKGEGQKGVAIQGEGASPFVKTSADKPLSSDEVYELAVRDEAVRLKIIGGYLQSINKTTAPLSLGGAGTLAAPPLKAKNIGDAGMMALRYFKKTAE